MTRDVERLCDLAVAYAKDREKICGVGAMEVHCTETFFMKEFGGRTDISFSQSTTYYRVSVKVGGVTFFALFDFTHSVTQVEEGFREEYKKFVAANAGAEVHGERSTLIT